MFRQVIELRVGTEKPPCFNRIYYKQLGNTPDSCESTIRCSQKLSGCSFSPCTLFQDFLVLVVVVFNWWSEAPFCRLRRGSVIPLPFFRSGRSCRYRTQASRWCRYIRTYQASRWCRLPTILPDYQTDRLPLHLRYHIYHIMYIGVSAWSCRYTYIPRGTPNLDQYPVSVDIVSGSAANEVHRIVTNIPYRLILYAVPPLMRYTESWPVSRIGWYCKRFRR